MILRRFYNTTSTKFIEKREREREILLNNNGKLYYIVWKIWISSYKNHICVLYLVFYLYRPKLIPLFLGILSFVNIMYKLRRAMITLLFNLDYTTVLSEDYYVHPGGYSTAIYYMSPSLCLYSDLLFINQIKKVNIWVTSPTVNINCVNSL